MKRYVYYRPSGAIQQISSLPDQFSPPPIEGLLFLEIEEGVDIAGKHVEDGALVDGAVDDRTNEQQVRDAAFGVLAKRDALLAESDWIAIRAFDTGAAMPTDWQAYRQALRDIPAQEGFPLSVRWPTPPG